MHYQRIKPYTKAKCTVANAMILLYILLGHPLGPIELHKDPYEPVDPGQTYAGAVDTL